MLYYVVLAVGVVVSLVFCYQRRLGFSVNNLIFKLTSSLCFLLTAVFALINNPSAHIYGSLIIMGGALGLVGDILLDLKGVYSNDMDIYLKGGFFAFLVGHIFYFGAIIYCTGMKWYLALACILAAILVGAVTVLLEKPMQVKYGKYKKIVFLYTTFLAITMLTSIVTMVTSGFQTGFILLAVGSVLFLLSDVVLSGTFFGVGKDKPHHYFINHFLYYAGQYLIAASVMFVDFVQ